MPFDAEDRPPSTAPLDSLSRQDSHPAHAIFRVTAVAMQRVNYRAADADEQHSAGVVDRA
jgi:hypothetical protein